MKNKRILTYSEFDSEYGGNGKKGIQAGNDQASIDLFKNAPNELDEPTISDDNKIDAVDSKPATNKIKTDYESTPQSPNGPSALSNEDESTKGEVGKKSIEDIKAKFKKSMNKKAKRKVSKDIEPVENEIDDEEKDDVEIKSKKKLTPKQKEELRREKEGNY